MSAFLALLVSAFVSSLLLPAWFRHGRKDNQ